MIKMCENTMKYGILIYFKWELFFIKLYSCIDYNLFRLRDFMSLNMWWPVSACVN